jgi:hypothetical protein
MNVRDRVRVERAVLSYDWWLDLRGTPWRWRRELRAELRSNLREATARIGSKAAVAALGSTRQMAADATTEDATRPRWTAGLQSAVAALAVTLFAAFLAALAWSDGVLSAEPGRPVSGSVTLLPGSSMEYAPLGDGFAVSYGVGWLPVAVALLVFVLVARPWRALSGRRVTV